MARFCHRCLALAGLSGVRCQRATVAVLLGAAIALLSASPARGAEPPTEIQALILKAGNTEDDDVRLDLLKQLQSRPDLDKQLKSDVDRMVAFVDRWQHDKSLWSWYQREIRKTADYNFGLSADSPLAPIASFYRGRMLFWVTNEYGNIIGYHDQRRRLLDKAVEEFQAAARAFPENRIARMYLGQAIPCEREYPGVEDAPDWAVYQRENLERLTDLVEWWIDNRLKENGEYGGAWDDDCEMWRHWVPVMIAFEHPKITQAQAFFSNALLSQDYMKGGYTNHLYDVEHTAEPTTDTITPMMHLAPDDPVWQKRARRLAELMEALWTGRNDRGQLQFKSTYFNFQRVDPDPVKACDTPYHPVAIPPALLLWLRTGDEQLGKLFTDWMDTWVDATARAEGGKPAGVIPAAIHWPDGVCKGPGENWWDPRHHNEPRLYQWPAAMSKMTDTLLLTYHMTGNEKYLQPLRSMAAMRLKWLKSEKGDGTHFPERPEGCFAEMSPVPFFAEPGQPAGPIMHREAYREIGDPAAIAWKDKTFVVERRGGYPWAQGFFGRNDTSPLPIRIERGGKETTLSFYVGDDLKGRAERIQSILLRVVLFDARDEEGMEVTFNGVALPLLVRDPEWKDPQIFSPRPQPPSGGNGNYRVNPQQHLLRLDFTVTPQSCILGENAVTILVPESTGPDQGTVQLEKLELHVRYSEE